MNRKDITIQEAREIWKKVKDDKFFLASTYTFEDYWRECERINSLPDNEWQRLINENQQKLEEICRHKKSMQRLNQSSPMRG